MFKLKISAGAVLIMLLLNGCAKKSPGGKKYLIVMPFCRIFLNKHNPF